MDTSLNEKKEPNKPASKLSGLLKLKFIIPAIIAALLLTTTFSIVMAKKKFADGPHGFMMGMLINKLDLTESQKAQVEKIRDEIHARMETNMNDHQSIRDDMATEFAKDNMDKNKLLELDKKRQQDMDENREFMMDKMIEFHNILTPDQRQKAADLMKDGRGNFRRGMGNGPNGPDCPNCQNCPKGFNGPNGPNGPGNQNGSKWKIDKEN